MSQSHHIPPELVDEIAKRCSPSTLAALSRVSSTSQYISQHYLYHRVTIPHPRRPRDMVDRIIGWSTAVLNNQRLALRLHSFCLGTSTEETQGYYESRRDSDSSPTFETALRLCVNLKELSILIDRSNFWSISRTWLRLLNDPGCPFHLTHIRSVTELQLQPSFFQTHTDLRVVSLRDYNNPDILQRLSSHALVAAHAVTRTQSILPAQSTRWKLERAFIQLKTPRSDLATLATYAGTLKVLTLKRIRGLGLRLDALVSLIALHIPLLLRLNVLEAEPWDARRSEGNLQEALKGFIALESFVLHLNVAIPDVAKPMPATTGSRKILPRNQVTFQPSNTCILRDSPDGSPNSVCGMEPCSRGLEDMAYRLMRSRRTLIHVDLGVRISPKGSGYHLLDSYLMSCVLQSLIEPREVTSCRIKRDSGFNAHEDFFRS
ncbi:hypothetical protein C8F01DRAFT_1262723 [Mycena amicta]|nr:hypothetical protein C8F01DRAFT_1262723 [Mycena amicta]